MFISLHHTTTTSTTTTTTTSGGSGLSNLTDWLLSSTGGDSGGVVFNSPGNNLSTTTTSVSSATSTKKIPAGTAFIVQYDASLDDNSGVVLVVQEQDRVALYEADNLIEWSLDSTGVGWFDCRLGSNDYNDYSRVNFTGTPKARLRGTGTLIYAEQSYDGGVTWASIADSTTMAQPQVDMWVQAQINGRGGNDINQKVMNIQSTALS